MFCANCSCKYDKWLKKCPVCKTSLIEYPHTEPRPIANIIDYTKLVEIVRKEYGSIVIELSTDEVGMELKWTFPHFGFGYAWAKSMHGRYRDIQVQLTTLEVGKKRKMRFPYLGYGYAWVQSSNGTLGGNGFLLSASQVIDQKTWSFPYFGFGFAWTQHMNGQCGDQLKVDLDITDYGRFRKWGNFPFLYRGFGFAWERSGLLTVTLNNSESSYKGL